MKRCGVSYDLKREEAVELLAAGELIKDTAKKLDLDRGTISNWLKDGEYRNRIIERSRELLAASYPQLYKIGLERAQDNAAYYKAVLDHLDKLDNKTAGVTEINITWGNSDT